MFLLYNLIVKIVAQLVKIVAFFNPKINLFVEGRKDVLKKLSNTISTDDKTIWFHAASLGEYEQGLPVIEEIKKHFPTHKIILTFFSPSGYEIRKNNNLAHTTLYLPLDTKKNALEFIKIAHPDMAFFIKYEFWPNYLNQLKTNNIPTFLISGIFREKQAFFKWYGGFYRQALKAFSHFFVQNEKSKSLINSLGYQNVSISGDTRFDRVQSIVERNNSLPFIEVFKDNHLTVVIGSSWPKDEELLTNYINQAPENIKFIIAPHNIKKEQIDFLQQKITKKSILFSEKENKNLNQAMVFIVDTIGILTKIYSYGDIAYVGGGFGNPGIHNILEPATFGLPVIIGPNFSHFAEAVALVNLEGCTVINNFTELKLAIDSLIYSSDERFEKAHICQTFVEMNSGATKTIINHILNINLN